MFEPYDIVHGDGDTAHDRVIDPLTQLRRSRADRYYAPNGKHLDVLAWHAMKPDAGGRMFDATVHGHVATVWIGISDEETDCETCERVGPLIFRTTVFRHARISERIITRTADLAAAAHVAAVAAEGPAASPTCAGGCAGAP